MFPVSALNVVAGQQQVWVLCHVQSANPGNNVQYTWTKLNDFNSSTVSTAQSYVIETVDVDDSGRYICTARNSAGSSSEYIDINVQCKLYSHRKFIYNLYVEKGVFCECEYPHSQTKQFLSH